MPAKLLKLRDHKLPLESPWDEHGAMGHGLAKTFIMLDQFNIRLRTWQNWWKSSSTVAKASSPKTSSLPSVRIDALQEREDFDQHQQPTSSVDAVSLWWASASRRPWWCPSSPTPRAAHQHWPSGLPRSTCRTWTTQAQTSLRWDWGGNKIQTNYSRNAYSSIADPELLLLRVVGVIKLGSNSPKLPTSQLLSDSFLSSACYCYLAYLSFSPHSQFCLVPICCWWAQHWWLIRKSVRFKSNFGHPARWGRVNRCDCDGWNLGRHAGTLESDSCCNSNKQSSALNHSTSFFVPLHSATGWRCRIRLAREPFGFSIIGSIRPMFRLSLMIKNER